MLELNPGHCRATKVCLSAAAHKQEVAVFSVQQMKQQVEVEKKAEVAMEMSDLVVYCQPRSKEKDRFGKPSLTLISAVAFLLMQLLLHVLAAQAAPEAAHTPARHARSRTR